MFDFQYNVNACEFLDEAQGLLYQHWEELANNKDTIKLSTDKIKYQQLQDVGILKNIVVYKDNKIIGYSVLLIQPHLHYSNNVYAYVDVIYVDKEYRGTSVGAKLLILTEKQAKEEGADVILHHAKPHVAMIVSPLKKLGYTVYEEIYGKFVGSKVWQ